MISLSKHAVKRFNERFNKTDAANTLKKVNQLISVSVEVKIKKYHRPRFRYIYKNLDQMKFLYHNAENMIFVIEKNILKCITIYLLDNSSYFEYRSGDPLY
jgi:hypothetical protein